MILLHLLHNLRWSRRLIENPFSNQLISSLHTRLQPPLKEKRPIWNSPHTSLPSNPLLRILETKCESMNHLKQIQAQMVATGQILDGFASSRLIAFCAISQSGGDLGYCSRILNDLRNPNIFSFNVAIRAYSESPQRPEVSVLLYKQLLRSGRVSPDHLTYPFLSKACSQLAMVRVGFMVLVHVFHLGFDSDIFIHNGVIHMLVSCGEVDSARQLFEESCVRDLVSWNSIINGYVRSGRPREGLELYREMKGANVKPDEVTMIGVVSLCIQLENLSLGREFHRYIEENGLKLTTPLSNALMDMYVKCGNLEQAEVLFNNMNKKTMVSWTTMLGGYAKFGFLDAARELFDNMPEKDVVSWNALISGYAQSKRGKDVLALFHEMQAMNVKPDEITMVSLLSACSQLGALDTGKWIHHYIDKHKFQHNVATGTALVDMYAKCGNISKALEVFHDIPKRNALTWTVVISGLALHGHAHDAISYFLEMIRFGLVPDEVTFLGVISACCHAGLVNEGRQFFSQMTSKFNILPKIKHYSCMVDLLGRAGHLEEAEQLIKSMPMEPDATVLGTLFFACRTHGNVAVGESVASKLLELDPDDGGTYVLLANMYLEANMQEKAEEVWRRMKASRVKKTPGCSSIEVDGDVSEFIVRDTSHPQLQEICECLIRLTKQSERFEYTTRARLVIRWNGNGNGNGNRNGNGNGNGNGNENGNGNGNGNGNMYVWYTFKMVRW